MTMSPITRRSALQTTAAATAAFACSAGHAQDKERDPKEIRIGQSAMLTGPLAVAMVGPLKGQELAIDEVNRKGGIGGRPIRLTTLDDAYDIPRAIENTNKLIDEEKVVALFGYANSGAIAAVLPMLLDKKVPLIGPYAGSPSQRIQFHPYFFTTTASYRDEVVQIIRVMVSSQKGQIGVIYQNHPFGQLMLPVVEAVAKELGATIAGKVSLESNGSDAAAAVQALAPAKPQAVLLIAFGPATVSVIKALRSSLAVQVFAISIANNKTLVDALGDEGRGLAFTALIPYPWRQTTPLTRDFAAVMSKAGLPINYNTFTGYVSTRVLIEGLKRAAAGGKPLTPASVTAGMEAIGKFDMGGYPLNFGPRNHHGSSFVEIIILGPNGKYMR